MKSNCSLSNNGFYQIRFIKLNYVNSIFLLTLSVENSTKLLQIADDV